VYDDVQRRGDLSMYGGARNAAQQTERFEPGWHVARRVGVQCPGAALVTGIERAEQINDFCSAALADDETIGAHPQCLPDQLSQANDAGTFDVRRTGLEADDVRVIRPQFGGVLDDYDALVPRHFT
jgi:hypothetical protein